jgi:hypothetical protein
MKMLVYPLPDQTVSFIFCIFAHLLGKEWCISVILIFITLTLLFMCLRGICASLSTNYLCIMFTYFYWVINYQRVDVLYYLLVYEESWKYSSLSFFFCHCLLLFLLYSFNFFCVIDLLVFWFIASVPYLNRLLLQ